MAELRPRIREIRDAGGDLVVVGTGGPSFADAFRLDLGIPDVRILTDETRRAYDLAGFRRGVATLLHPRAIWNYLRAFFSGYAPRSQQGDALQQGGVLVVRPDGRISFRHESRVSGDHPATEAILAAVRAAAGSADRGNSG